MACVCRATPRLFTDQLAPNLLSRVYHLLNFSNQTTIQEDMAIFVKSYYNVIIRAESQGGMQGASTLRVPWGG